MVGDFALLFNRTSDSMAVPTQVWYLIVSIPEFLHPYLFRDLSIGVLFGA